MSKPILSELEYNADDVASAILQQADLSVTNEDFGVADRSSLFVINSSNIGSMDDLKAYSFNGFMFVQGRFGNSGSAPTSGDTLATISDSDFYPTYNAIAPVVSYQGDTASRFEIDTSGNLYVLDPTSAGDSHWRCTFNLWYRYA